MTAGKAGHRHKINRCVLCRYKRRAEHDTDEGARCSSSEASECNANHFELLEQPSHSLFKPQ